MSATKKRKLKPKVAPKEQTSHADGREEVLAVVDRLIEPGSMTLHEALNWLEELSGSLDVRIEAIREDIAR